MEKEALEELRLASKRIEKAADKILFASKMEIYKTGFACMCGTDWKDKRNTTHSTVCFVDDEMNRLDSGEFIGAFRARMNCNTLRNYRMGYVTMVCEMTSLEHIAKEHNERVREELMEARKARKSRRK